MSDAETSLRAAEMRLARAVSTVHETLDDKNAVPGDRWIGSITRIVIAANTMAEALHLGADQPLIANSVADLLWSFGEQLGIDADGARK